MYMMLPYEEHGTAASCTHWAGQTDAVFISALFCFSSTVLHTLAFEYGLSPKQCTISGALLAWPSPSRAGIPKRWPGDLDV